MQPYLAMLDAARDAGGVAGWTVFTVFALCPVVALAGVGAIVSLFVPAKPVNRRPGRVSR